MLCEVADCLTADLRAYDLVIRVGGDEFVCALSGETLDHARRRYDRVAERLAEAGNGTSVTVGLAVHRAGESMETLVHRADRAMLATRR